MFGLFATSHEGEQMDSDNVIAFPSKGEWIAKKSWVAYIGVGLIALLLFFIAVPVAWSIHWIAGLIVLVVSALFVGYRVLLLRSYELYFDDVGIWVSSGVFPWEQGVYGVKWRDVDSAFWTPTFWSWLFKSYSIEVKRRLETYSGIYLEHMREVMRWL
jgi:hypothetical protein